MIVDPWDARIWTPRATLTRRLLSNLPGSCTIRDPAVNERELALGAAVIAYAASVLAAR